ncbi:ParB/RepB/Spo0J family partition protein [Sulfurimonas sp. HSL3-7]|uniref:ParB/RepB/Spo0J family partition protein n=1 Tax=Sulfonitrofixus jiaomeiensis TaxID=3131938 RepID=UPI0031F877CC
MGKSKAKSLGRGLGELLGEIEEAYESEMPSSDSVVELPLSQIKANPYQPRKHFDEHSLAELADSIKTYGLIQPIVVVEDIDGYILVAGERRLRASKIAKLKTIRAVIAHIDEEKMRQQALIENIQRDELNVVDLAHAYGELLEVHGITHDELSSMVHKSRAHITNTLRLLQLSKKTLAALKEGKITAGHAKVLVGLSDKEQATMVASIVGQKLSVRDIETMAKSMKNSSPAAPVKAKKESFDLTGLADRFKDLGFKVKTKSNEITISFDSEEAIAKLINRL